MVDVPWGVKAHDASHSTGNLTRRYSSCALGLDHLDHTGADSHLGGSKSGLLDHRLVSSGDRLIIVTLDSSLARPAGHLCKGRMGNSTELPRVIGNPSAAD